MAAILAAPVRVKDETSGGFTSPDCHDQCQSSISRMLTVLTESNSSALTLNHDDLIDCHSLVFLSVDTFRQPLQHVTISKLVLNVVPVNRLVGHNLHESDQIFLDTACDILSALVSDFRGIQPDQFT